MSQPPSVPPARKPTPKWLRILSGIVAIVCIVVALLIWFGQKSMMGTKYAVSEKESVNYSGSATAQDAQALGEALKKIGFFDDTKAADVLLHTDQTGTAISFVVDHGWDNEEILTSFKQIGEMLVQGLKVTHLKIRLIDEHLNTKKEIQIN
jgi:hypothetical protein